MTDETILPSASACAVSFTAFSTSSLTLAADAVTPTGRTPSSALI